MIKKAIHKYQSMPVQVKASFWFIVSSFLQRGISVITTPIFTRLLTTGDYGQYGVFNSWLDIVSIFVTFRLYYGVFVQGLVKFGEDRARYVSSLQGLSFTLSSCWTAIYFLFRNFWNELFGLTTVQMLAMLVMIWSTGALRFWAAEQRNEYKYRALVAVTIIVSILKPTLGIFLVIHAEDKVTARILGLALAEFIGYSWIFIYHMWRGRQFYSGNYWKHALMFNIPLIPHYLSQTVLNNADRIMIRDMVGASEAGMYTLAYSISKIMTIFNQALINTLTPWLYQKIKANRTKDIAPIVYMVMIGVAFINLVLIALAPEVIMVFGPSSYHDAIWIIPPVTMGVYFLFVYHMFAAVEFYYEKTRLIMAASVAGAALNIVLNYIFIPIFGYYAAGYTTLVCYFVYTLCHYINMMKVCKEQYQGEPVYNVKILLIITGAFLGIGFAFLGTYRYPAVRYTMIAVLVGICIFFREKIKEGLSRLLEIRKKKRGH